MNLLNDKYLIIKKIRLSTNHELRIAKVHPTKEEVVLKFFPKSKSLKFVEAEIKFMEKMKDKSPYVINMIESFEYKDQIVLTFPYYKRGDLYEFVQRTSVFPETKTKIFIEKLLKGLKAIHDTGIIVRDIKPENILVNKDGSPIIIDFDLAISINEMEKQEDGTYRDNTMCGTLESMPPESYKKIYSFKTDVFSVGCVTYYLLTGMGVYSNDKKQLAYNFESTKKIFAYDHITGKKLPSEECKDFINKCLSIDIADRSSVDELLNHQWFLKKIEIKLGAKRPRSMTIHPKHSNFKRPKN